MSKFLKRVFPPGIPNSQPRSPRIQTLSARYLTYTSSGRRISHSGPDSPHRTGCATGPYSFSAPQKIEELNDVSANTRLIEVSRFRGGTRANSQFLQVVQKKRVIGARSARELYSGSRSAAGQKEDVFHALP